MSHTEAMDRARHELGMKRVIMTRAAYEAAFKALVLKLMWEDKGEGWQHISVPMTRVLEKLS